MMRCSGFVGMSLSALVLSVSLLGGPAGAQGVTAPEVVYRSSALERTAGAPNVYRAVFQTCDPDGRFRLVLDNGADGGQRVSSASVSLNGVQVLGQRDFNQQVEQLVRPVGLAASNTLEVRLAGGPGGRVRVTVDGYMSCLRIRITSPAPGSVLREPAAVVEGDVESRRPVGVRVRATLTLRGYPVDLYIPTAVSGRRFAARADLAPGAVRFVAVASDDTGRTAEDAISVTFQPDPPEYTRAWRPDVSPTVGFAPLAVTFDGRAARGGGVELLDLDADGDGRPDFSLTDFASPPHQVTYTYQGEGLYVATMSVRDLGLTLTSRVPINVIPRPDLPVIWNGLRAALARADVEGTLGFVAEEARDRYRRVFEDLRADLPARAAALQDATPLRVEPEYATAGTTRVRNGQVEGFLIHFVRDADGVWRIASM